ncbi:DUF1330 domain-containing protein [Nonomuraea sp. NPDC048826]|uniref:DUF1330 domain-containing protein n=1 Tax=Nonomuraea sp. NPDC048826 TaxID=3364347 RepID=UPI003720C2FC
MSAYAIAHLKTPNLHPDVLTYMERIQETLDPFGGRFIVHGPTVEVFEGEWPGSIVIIQFDDMESARNWYASPGYQKILPMRTDHIDGVAILAEGVGPGYDPATRAAALRAAAPQ